MSRLACGLLAALRWPAVVLGLCAPVLADTPADVVVMAHRIDDLITLDPAEIYEFAGGEYAANVYDRLIGYNLDNPGRFEPGLADLWTLSPDGRTYTFYLRPGARFASGNPVTAHDAAFSLRRVVELAKGPSFILATLGFTRDNLDRTVRAIDDRTLVLRTNRAYSPSFVLSALGSWVGSVVDSNEVRAHAAHGDAGGDHGNGWLSRNAAGSGPFRLADWKPADRLVLDRFEGHWQGAPAVSRVIVRHVPESAVQRLLLEQGDVDVARNLGPDDLAAVGGDPRIRVASVMQGAITYLGMNQRHPMLSRPEVREALRYLVDYAGIQDHILRKTKVVHQSFLPLGFLGAIDDRPFALDVDKARTLLGAAGVLDGLRLSLDVPNSAPALDIAQSLQQTFARAGVRLDLVPGDNKQVLTKYRARRHELFMGRWAPDFLDPHSNASGFAYNPEVGEGAEVRLLAWRNGWSDPVLSAKVDEALAEADEDRRAALYRDLQRRVIADGPYVFLFQDIQVVAVRDRVRGFRIGPNFDATYYRSMVKR